MRESSSYGFARAKAAELSYTTIIPGGGVPAPEVAISVEAAGI